ncbi:MAG: AAA family ATPase [Meiothermus sp.]|nr:AAA family ATPase [Meiothermus sp.]
MPSDRRGTALIVGKFAPPHRGHQHLIETALADRSLDDWVVLVYSNPDFLPNMPSHRRAAWIQHLYPQVRVFAPENPPPNAADDFTQREFVKGWLGRQVGRQVGLHHIQPDVVYTSESYGEGFAEHIGARHVLVDLPRTNFPLSGTRVREVLAKLEASRRISSSPCCAVEFDPDLLDQLAKATDPYIFKQLLRWLEPVKRVVFLGAESTGKSTLTEAVAKEMGMPFVAEYGREHYERKGGVMELEDYLHIARRHRELEDAARLRLLGEGRGGYVFSDTNALTTLFFSYYYHQGGLPELHRIANLCNERYHHVFVCADDIPFAQDGWRDNEAWRGRMQGLVLHDLDSRGIPYTLVWGSLEGRVRQVRQVLDGLPGHGRPQLPQLGPRPS